MSVRELLIAGSRQKGTARTFVAQTHNDRTLVVHEWKRSGVVTQDSTTVSGKFFNEIIFSPSANSFAVYETTGAETLIYAWDKDTGIGSQVGSAQSGKRIIDISPAGDAIVLYDSSSSSSEVYAYSASGVGSLIDSTSSRIRKFSKSGNYLIATSGSSTAFLMDWDVSTGIGSTYNHPSSTYGSVRGDLSKDDSFFITIGTNGNGGMDIHPFDGSSLSASISSIELGNSVPFDININERQDAVVAAVADSTSPYDFVAAVPINPNKTFGTQFSASSSLKSLSQGNLADFNATGNVVMFTQNSNFVIQKFTSSGFGDELYRDQTAGSTWADIIEVT